MPIGFKAETGLNETGSHQVSMKLLRKAAGDLENIDLFILLNAESIDVLDGNNCNTMTRKALKDATFNSNFGINTNGSPQATTVPDTGLPISRVITNINVKDNIADNAADAATKPVSVPLVRAVSKLHFFFTRKDVKDTEGVEVTKIEVNEGIVPTQSSVFPTATTYANKETYGLTGDLTSLTYLNEKMTFGRVATEDIKPVPDPTSYIRKTQTAEEYIKKLREATTECYLSYLRETGEELTGTIYFTLRKNGAEKHKTFSISKAYRNHEMVVYGYFLGDEESTLTLKYYVADWTDKGTTNIEFN